MKRTTVKIPDELDARLRGEAKRSGLTISQVTPRSARGSPRRRGAAPTVPEGDDRFGSEWGRQPRRSHRGDPGRRGRAVSLLVDSGPLLAALDTDDRDHERCAALLNDHPGPLLVPTLCIAEVSHFAATRLDDSAEVAFLLAIASGDLTVEDFHPADRERTVELVAEYRDLPLGAVDASIVAAAERLEIRRIATLDRQHFSVVRPKHVEAFDLVP